MPSVRRVLALLLGALLLTSLVGVPSAEAAKPTIVYTDGPGTKAPPNQLGYLLVTPFPEDSRALGEDVTTVGPLQLSSPATHERIGEGWKTWSHGYTGDVYTTEGVTITLPAKTSAFYFYAEPERFSTIKIKAVTDDGTTSKSVAVQGEAGAKFFGFYSRLPLTDFITSVTLSSSEEFAFGELGIQSVFGKYVALGDSFSSGEGTGDYYTSTDTPENRCHRSPESYSVLLTTTDKSLRPLHLAACSGSVTQDLVAPNHLYSSEEPQEDSLSSLASDVTLTIGGNDVGFAGVVDACVKARHHADGRGCSKDPEVTEPVDARLRRLAGSGDATAPGDLPITDLVSVISSIHSKAPKAKVYVGGYPELFGGDRSTFRKDATSPSGYVCDVNTAAAASLDYADVQWFNKKTRELNKIIKSAVATAKTADKTLKAVYVSPSTFDGHGLCDQKKSWINKVILVLDEDGFRDPGSLHPTPEGQRSGYREAFKKAGL